MTTLNYLNVTKAPNDKQTSLASTPMKYMFFEWLRKSAQKKYSTEIILSCIDRTSEYSILKKISTNSLWEYKTCDAFKPIYDKLLKAIPFRITNRKTHKVFIVAGQLYLSFLKEKPWETVIAETIDSNTNNVNNIERTPDNPMVVRKEQISTKTVVPSNDLATMTPLFKKKVDWSLLNYGFAIPQTAIDTFRPNIGGKIMRGDSLDIKLIINENTYHAKLNNVGFSNESREQLQVRYGGNSPAVVALRKIFKSSYSSMIERRNNNQNNLKLEDKEYVDIVCVSPGIYGLICYPSTYGALDKALLKTSKTPSGINQKMNELIPEPESNETKSTVETYVLDKTTAENKNVKVGSYVRSKLRQLSESGFAFSEEQLRNICDFQWSQETLKISAPCSFAKIIGDTLSLDNLVKNKNGYNRYWNEPFIFNDVKLIFISQWCEKSQHYFDKWFASLNTNVVSTDVFSSKHTHQQKDTSNKYTSLEDRLIKYNSGNIQMTFAEISEIVGGLPLTAYKHPTFWSNINSHSIAVAWMKAGYKVIKCDLKKQIVNFAKSDTIYKYNLNHKKTIKEAMIEFSNKYKGEIKTTKEIVNELSIKYGFNENSILPADYEISLDNSLPKLFRRTYHGTFKCLGHDNVQATTTSFSPGYDSNYSLDNENRRDKIMTIITEKFKSGFRMSSSIDFERFKNYYTDKFGEEYRYSADTLEHLLCSEAVIFDDRAYFYNDEIVRTVRIYLEKLGSPCIYIDYIFKKYSRELYNFNIFSTEMLKAFIEKNYYDISVKYDYILITDNMQPADLIRRAFNERETWSFDDLQEKLPYLKTDTIKQTLNGVEYFRIDRGTYTHIDNIDLPNNEGEIILSFVNNRLQKKNYITANELDLSKFESLNPHCPFTAIRDAVFHKFLSDSYDKRGQVITKKGNKLCVLDILEQYCREAETVSFDELNAFETTFDQKGRTHSQCLVAGHNTMIRVSSELFVAYNKVDFDVEKTDDAIALYCYDNFIPLRRVTDFSLFPYAGYQWNLFLLESYVRKFSRVFKFDVRAVNSSNIGIIVKKSFKYNDYNDILTIALANSPVKLNDKKAVGNYLFDKGYIGWRNLGKNEKKIIENAEKLKKGDTV